SLVREHRDSIPEGSGPAGQPSHIFHRRCACPAPPLQWDGGDGGTMAKKTTADYLARLPQFEPRSVPFADLKEYDVQVQREQGIDVQVQEEQGNTPWLGKMPKPLRCERIDDVLSKFMAPHIRDAATKLEPFLNDAKRAIAGYVGARETEYDRRRAKKLLSA